MKLYLATSNRGKAAELRPLVEEFLPIFDDIHCRAPRDAEETADSFAGNSRIKAESLSREIRSEGMDHAFAVLSDDSGLVVDSLGGRPGVHSARYSGVCATNKSNIEKLLRELGSSSQRACRYVCNLCLLVNYAGDATMIYQGEGTCEGLILGEAKGEGGFGYDPIFWSLDLKERMSLATLEAKNGVSHRRRAFEDLKIRWEDFRKRQTQIFRSQKG